MLPIAIFIFLLFIPAVASATTEILWLRPVSECPNNGNGTAYTCAASVGAVGAWNAPANIVQGATDETAATLDPEDTLYICGSVPWTRVNTSINGTSTKKVRIDGSCPGGIQGIINGAANVTDDRLWYVAHSDWEFHNLTCINQAAVSGDTCIMLSLSPRTVVKNSSFYGNWVDAATGVSCNSCNGPFTIENNFFTGYQNGLNITGGGSWSTASVSTIKNNICDDMRWSTGDGGQCILVGAGDFNYFLVISYNLITRWQGEAIDLNGGTNVIVERNVMTNPLDNDQAGTSEQGLKAGGLGDANIIRWNLIDIRSAISRPDNAAITSGTSGTTAGADDMEIYGNLILGGDRGIVVAGISTDIATGARVYNNTLIGQKKYGILVSNFVTDVDVRNNVIQTTGGAVLADLRVGTATGSMIGGNNALLNTWPVLVESGGIYTGTGDIDGSASTITADYKPVIGSTLYFGGQPQPASAWPSPHDYLGCRFDPGKPSIGAFELCGGSRVARTKR